MLTTEQLAQFEARAAAGEKPRMEWKNARESSSTFIGNSNEMLFVSKNDWRDEWWCNMTGGSLSGIRFSSLSAAQLAAEHLLLVAVALLLTRGKSLDDLAREQGVGPAAIGDIMGAVMDLPTPTKEDVIGGFVDMWERYHRIFSDYDFFEALAPVLREKIREEMKPGETHPFHAVDRILKRRHHDPPMLMAAAWEVLNDKEAGQ